MNIYAYIYIHTCVCIYIHMYIYVYVYSTFDRCGLRSVAVYYSEVPLQKMRFVMCCGVSV